MPLRRRPSFQLASWLVFAAVLFRALLPDGFMLQRNPGGNVALAFCYASALARLRHDGIPNPSHAHSGCAFAAAAAPALPGAGIPLPNIFVAAATLAATPSQRPPARFSSGRPRARAPPTLA